MRSQVVSQEPFPAKNIHAVLTSSNIATTDAQQNQKENEAFIGVERWINSKDLKQTIIIFRALNHQLRKTIMDLLDKHESMTVTQIYMIMKLDQSVASQHLSILRKAGLVKTEKEGKFIFYSLNKSKLIHLSELMANINSCN